MMIELKLQAAASVTPVRSMGCMRAKQCEAALSPKLRVRKAQAEGEKGGRDDDRAEAAGGSEPLAHSRRPSCASTIEAATRADGRGGIERGREDEMR